MDQEDEGLESRHKEDVFDEFFRDSGKYGNNLERCTWSSEVIYIYNKKKKVYHILEMPWKKCIIIITTKLIKLKPKSFSNVINATKFHLINSFSTIKFLICCSKVFSHFLEFLILTSMVELTLIELSFQFLIIYTEMRLKKILIYIVTFVIYA